MIRNNTEQLILQRSVLQAREILSDYPYLAYHARLQTYQEDFDRTVVRLATEVLTYAQSDETHIVKHVRNTITRPRFANPWEHFKARYAGRVWMRWYVKRKPIKFTEEKYNISFDVDIDLTQMLSFPEASYIFPPEIGNPVLMVRRNSEKVAWNGPIDNPLTDRW